MTNTVTISELPAGVTPTGGEAIPAVQGSATVRITPAQLAAYFESLPTIVGITISLSAPAITLPCNNAGVVLDYGGAVGLLQVYAGQNNITSQCTLSVQSQTNLSGCTINTSVNTPVAGQPEGYYVIGAISNTANQGTLTLAVSYEGNIYTASIIVAKSLAGATGSSGSGTSALSIFLSNPVAVLPCYSNGTVISYAVAQGQLNVYSGQSNITSSCTLSATTDSSATTGTINTATNTPVSGQPLGFYEITNMNNNTGYLTITAVYSGVTLTAVFNCSKANVGYPSVSTLPSSGALVFNNSIVLLTAVYDGNPANILYQYNSSSASWAPLVSAANLTGTLAASQIASITASQISTQLTASQIAAINASIINGQISQSQIANGAVGTNQLGSGAVLTGNIGAAAVTAVQIAGSTILGSNIAGGTIQATNIQAGAITTNQISATAGIIGGQLAAGTITAGNIAANTITASQISASAGITGNQIAANTIQAGNIAANTIGAGQIVTSGLSASAITTGTLSASVIDLDNATLTATGGVLQVNGSGIQTANIATSAVSNVTAATNSSVVTISTGTYTDLIGSGISVTTAGGKLVIAYGAALIPTNGGTNGVVCYLYRAATQLSEVVSVLSYYAIWTGQTIIDTPAAGTYTYHVYGYGNSGTAGEALAAWFTCTELKR